jgi:hypothetical protein
MLRGTLIAVCIGVTGAGSPQSPLTVNDVIEHSDQYIGQRITVVGRLHAQVRTRDEPTDQRPNELPRATLHLRTTGTASGTTKSLDLYRSTDGGSYEPLSCLMETSGRCGGYEPGAVMTIAGTWVRYRIPAGEVIRPGKGTEVIAWRIADFLVVARP